MKLLYVDASVRINSRTKELADYLLTKLDVEIDYLRLEDYDFQKMTKSFLSWRMSQCDKADYSDSYFDLAKRFKSADLILIAAPYWDLSFPASLKNFIENICISGLTMKYSDVGIPVGLTNIKKLYYVTTAGGPIISDEFGYGYISTLFKTMFEIKESLYIKCENLDIVGNNPIELLEKTKSEIDKLIKEKA